MLLTMPLTAKQTPEETVLMHSIKKNLMEITVLILLAVKYTVIAS